MEAQQQIILRAPEPEDLDRLLKWENDSGIWQAGNVSMPISRFAMEQYIISAQEEAFKQEQIRFMIGLSGAEAAQTIGTADLFELNAFHRRAGVGIMIDREYRNRGYARQALEKLLEYAFDNLDLQQVFARIREDNPASIRLFRSTGFVQTGSFRAWLKTAGSYIDEIFMQNLNPTYHDREK